MTLTQKVFILKSIAPFNSLSDSELIITANMTQLKHYEKGKKIYSAGNSVYNLFIIAEGQVYDSFSKEQKGFFGLKALINDELMEHDYIALNNVSILMISKAHLLTLLFECPYLMLGFLSLHKEENHETQI